MNNFKLSIRKKVVGNDPNLTPNEAALVIGASTKNLVTRMNEAQLKKLVTDWLGMGPIKGEELFRHLIGRSDYNKARGEAGAIRGWYAFHRNPDAFPTMRKEQFEKKYGVGYDDMFVEFMTPVKAKNEKRWRLNHRREESLWVSDHEESDEAQLGVGGRRTIAKDQSYNTLKAKHGNNGYGK